MTNKNNDSIARVDAALAALKQGKLVVVADDVDREHEGDLIGLAAFATPESVNTMLTLGRGLICVPMPAERAKQLDLAPMVADNSEAFGTNFTISVDHVSTTTGVSASDRASTIKQLANLSATAGDFQRPGHMFPLIAADGGVLARTGHTEAAVDLAALAGVPPVGYIVEILKPDGTMARDAELEAIAATEELPFLTIADLVVYRQSQQKKAIQAQTIVDLPTDAGDFELHSYARHPKK